MKKIFVCALALAAFAACQKNEVIEVPQGTAIAFNTFVDKSTKVTEADDMSTANLKSFGLYGWRTGETTLQNFSAQKVTANNGVCTYSPVQYWENGYTYQFEAVSPEAAEGVLAVESAVAGSKLTFTSNSITDLVWARPEAVTYTATENAPAPVELTFQHLLSRVMFRVHNQFPENAAAKITVKEITINDAVKTATLTPVNANEAWAATEKGLTVNFDESKLVDIAAGGNYAETDHMYLIPADITSVTLKYTLDQNGVETDYDFTYTFGEGGNTTPEGSLSLTRGMSLRINVVLNEQNIDPENPLFPIVFTAEVEEWE